MRRYSVIDILYHIQSAGNHIWGYPPATPLRH